MIDPSISFTFWSLNLFDICKDTVVCLGASEGPSAALAPQEKVTGEGLPGYLQGSQPMAELLSGSSELLTPFLAVRPVPKPQTRPQSQYFNLISIAAWEQQGSGSWRFCSFYHLFSRVGPARSLGLIKVKTQAVLAWTSCHGSQGIALLQDVLTRCPAVAAQAAGACEASAFQMDNLSTWLPASQTGRPNTSAVSSWARPPELPPLACSCAWDLGRASGRSRLSSTALPWCRMPRLDRSPSGCPWRV